jgi:hypothetical protein
MCATPHADIRAWCRHRRRCRPWRLQTTGRHTHRPPGAPSAPARAPRPARPRPPGGREQRRTAPPARCPGRRARRGGRRRRGRRCQTQPPAPGRSRRPRPGTGGSPARVPGRQGAVDAGRGRRRPIARVTVRVRVTFATQGHSQRTVTASRCATPMAGSSAKKGASSAASRAGGRVWRSRAGRVSCVHSDNSVAAAPWGTSCAERRSRPDATVPVSVASTKDGCMALPGAGHKRTLPRWRSWPLRASRCGCACWRTQGGVCSVRDEHECEPPCVYAGAHGAPRHG